MYIGRYAIYREGRWFEHSVTYLIMSIGAIGCHKHFLALAILLQGWGSVIYIYIYIYICFTKTVITYILLVCICKTIKQI